MELKRAPCAPPSPERIWRNSGFCVAILIKYLTGQTRAVRAKKGSGANGPRQGVWGMKSPNVPRLYIFRAKKTKDNQEAPC